MTLSRSDRSLIVCAATFFVCATSAARAEPGKATWAGYLYQGPGYRYAVVDEVREAASFDVSGCANGWCRVTYGDRVGYLPVDIVTRTSLDRPGAGILAQPAAGVSRVPPAGPCVKADQTGGNGGNAMTVFCQK